MNIASNWFDVIHEADMARVSRAGENQIVLDLPLFDQLMAIARLAERVNRGSVGSPEIKAWRSEAGYNVQLEQDGVAKVSVVGSTLLEALSEAQVEFSRKVEDLIR